MKGFLVRYERLLLIQTGASIVSNYIIAILQKSLHQIPAFLTLARMEGTVCLRDKDTSVCVRKVSLEDIVRVVSFTMHITQHIH